MMNDTKYIAPDIIAKSIIDDISTLEGPVFASLLLPKPELISALGYTPPVFFLLGDVHTMRKKCTSYRNTHKSLYINKSTNKISFLDYLEEKGDTWRIDFFIEIWHGQDRGKASPQLNFNTIKYSSLLNIQYLTKPCTGKKRNEINPLCSYNKFRIHDADVRKSVLLIKNNGKISATHGKINIIDKYPIDAFQMILRGIIYYIKDAITIADIQHQIKKFKTDISSKLPDSLTIEQFLSIIQIIYTPGTPIDFFFDSPLFQNNSRTLHEFNKLPIFIRTMLRTKIKSVYGEYTSDIHNYYPDYIHHIGNVILLLLYPDSVLYPRLFREINIIRDTLELLCNNVIPLDTCLVDIYGLSRAFKFPNNNISLSSQLSVLYYGVDHTLYMMKLLEDYYTDIYQWGDYELVKNTNVMDLPTCINSVKIGGKKYKYRKYYTKKIRKNNKK